MTREQQQISQDIEAYLLENENKELLRFITCGSVDDGKSTLIGRLLYDSKLIYDDQLATITQESKRMGNVSGEMDFSLLLDGLESEREQGITIDVAYRYFSTQVRNFIIADTPGHEQYTRNMVTGASTANVALLLIDVQNELLVQTKRHTYICHLLGIKHLIVAINKMDLVAYSQESYEKIKEEYMSFVGELGITDVHCIPVSALHGDNVIELSSKMPWYQEQSILHCLEEIDIAYDVNTKDFRFPVQYVNRPHLNFRGYSGTIASGATSIGDKIAALPSHKKSIVHKIITQDGDTPHASAGMAVTLVLKDEIDVSRGDVIVLDNDEVPKVSMNFDAIVVWMSESPLEINTQYYIKMGTKTVIGSIVSVHYLMDVNTLAQCAPDHVQMNDLGKMHFEVNEELVIDPYSENRQTGRFIIIDRISNNTVGAGMIDSFVTAPSPTRRTRKVGVFERTIHTVIKKMYPHWNVDDI